MRSLPEKGRKGSGEEKRRSALGSERKKEDLRLPAGGPAPREGEGKEEDLGSKMTGKGKGGGTAIRFVARDAAKGKGGRTR